MLRVIGNTLYISLLKLIGATVPPLLLSIFLYDMRMMRAKKVVQTIVYIPHFFSWVIIYAITYAFLNEEGLLSTWLGTSSSILTDPDWFIFIVVLTNIWKELGWGTILYLAALSSVPPELYEAAKLDGAGPWQRVWRITLPSILPIVMYLLIINLGQILKNAGGEQLLLFGQRRHQAQSHGHRHLAVLVESGRTEIFAWRGDVLLPLRSAWCSCTAAINSRKRPRASVCGKEGKYAGKKEKAVVFGKVSRKPLPGHLHRRLLSGRGAVHLSALIHAGGFFRQARGHQLFVPHSHPHESDAVFLHTGIHRQFVSGASDRGIRIPNGGGNGSERAFDRHSRLRDGAQKSARAAVLHVSDDLHHHFQRRSDSHLSRS